MKLEIPKVILEAADTNRMFDILGTTWRDSGLNDVAVADPAIRYKRYADDLSTAVTKIAQQSFEAGIQYACQTLDDPK